MFRRLPELTERLRALRGWTPDFSAGYAELEIEQPLRRLHCLHRAGFIASGALQTVGRPEDVADPTIAWTTLATEAANTVLIWRRTSTWGSLLAPDVVWADRVLGLLAGTLGPRALTPEAQTNGFAWTTRFRGVRGSAVPLMASDPRQRALGAGLVVLPRALWPPRSMGGRALKHAFPHIALGTFEGLATSEIFRRQAVAADRHAVALADERLAQAAAAERAMFAAEIVRPTSHVLRAVRAAIEEGRSPAELAATEERRLRDWLAESWLRIDEPLTVDPAEAIEAGVAEALRLGRNIQVCGRIGSSVIAWYKLGKLEHRSHLTELTVVIRAAIALVAVSDGVTDAIGTPWVQRALAATDLLAVGAVTALESTRPDDRRVRDVAESLSYGVAATIDTAEADTPATRATTYGVAAVRALAKLAEDRPFARRLANATDEATMTTWTEWILRSLIDAATNAERELTAATIALAAASRDDGIRELRLALHSAVHDGAVQVLHAVATGDLERARLLPWIDQELDRLEQTDLGGTPAESIEESLQRLADEFTRRGAIVKLEVDPLPDWTRNARGASIAIVREAITNSLKHTDGIQVTIAASADGDRTTIAVTDLPGSPTTPFGPGDGPGAGTRTMQALADHIGASLSWDPTPHGGTQVSLVLVKPA